MLKNSCVFFLVKVHDVSLFCRHWIWYMVNTFSNLFNLFRKCLQVRSFSREKKRNLRFGGSSTDHFIHSTPAYYKIFRVGLSFQYQIQNFISLQIVILLCIWLIFVTFSSVLYSVLSNRFPCLGDFKRYSTLLLTFPRKYLCSRFTFWIFTYFIWLIEFTNEIGPVHLV